jgi:hypothetical protein
VMHFSGARGISHEWNAKPEQIIGFSITILRKKFPFSHPGN